MPDMANNVAIAAANNQASRLVIIFPNILCLLVIAGDRLPTTVGDLLPGWPGSRCWRAGYGRLVDAWSTSWPPQATHAPESVIKACSHVAWSAVPGRVTRLSHHLTRNTATKAAMAARPGCPVALSTAPYVIIAPNSANPRKMSLCTLLHRPMKRGAEGPPRQMCPGGSRRLENVRPFLGVGSFLCPRERVIALRPDVFGFGGGFGLLELRGRGLPRGDLLDNIAVEPLDKI